MTISYRIPHLASRSKPPNAAAPNSKSQSKRPPVSGEETPAHMLRLQMKREKKGGSEATAGILVQHTEEVGSARLLAPHRKVVSGYLWYKPRLLNGQS